jgi:small subunit ribosomal protein S2
MPAVTMRQLLEAGIHFGHQTRRWNPKMGRYIFGQRNGIYIIDLQKTLRQARRAYDMARDAAAQGGRILFVGTKKQAQEPVAREAARCGMYYINSRWLGGTLTNFRTVQQSIRRLKDLEERESEGRLDLLSKREGSRLRKEMQRLQKNLDGIKDMGRLPTLMFVIDTKKEAIAVREAQRLDIPCIGVVDTNADPDAVSLPVPGNDDAIRAINLFCSLIADAALEGQAQGQKSGDVEIKEDEQGQAASASYGEETPEEPETKAEDSLPEAEEQIPQLAREREEARELDSVVAPPVPESEPAGPAPQTAPGRHPTEEPETE